MHKRIAFLVAVMVGAMCHGTVRGDTAPEPVSSGPKLSSLGLEQLLKIEVTTVSRTESTVGESPAAIFVITSEMIRRSGATTIPELFRMVPGMDVARIDNNKWAVGARGFNQRFAGNLLVQIDGRTLYNPIFSGVYWDTVDYPLEDIERIEVIRGPGASVWGANAVNGVINIITKSAKDTMGGRVSGGGGTEEQGFGEFKYGGKASDNLYYRVYGKGFNRDEQFSAQGNSHDGWWDTSAGLRLDWQASDRDAVMFEGGYFHAEAGRLDFRPLATAPFYYTNAEYDVSSGGNVVARWAHTVDEKSNWALQAYWDHVKRNSTHGLLGQRWDTYDIDFQHQFPLGERQTILYGFGYRLLNAVLARSAADNGFDLLWDPSRLTRQVFSAFVQDQIVVVEDTFTLTLGTKLEHNDITGVEVQPTARLLWTPTKKQSVWAAVSRAVRIPSLLEDELRTKTLTTPGSPVIVESRGNSDLAAESVLAYELGYRAQVTGQVAFDIATFYNVCHDLIGSRIGPTEVDPPITIKPANRANTLQGETEGVEVAANWQPVPWWRLNGAYTFLEMQLHRASGLPATAEAAERQSPEQQIHLQSAWDLPGHVEFDLIGRFVDRLQGFNPGGVPGVPNTVNGYVTMDARLSWRPRKTLEFQVVGQNLLQSHHPEFGTSPTVRSPLVEIQRAVYGKVTWWF